MRAASRPPPVPGTPMTPVARLPGLVTLPAWRVAGPAGRFEESTKAAIPQLWPALTGALPFAGQTPSWATYGVICGVDKDSFQYMAGVGVAADCVPPPGFSTMEIPSASYAVFRITLDGAALHPQVKQAMATIWGELIPQSGLTVADGPRFERYDARFDPRRAGSVIDFHVPVRT